MTADVRDGATSYDPPIRPATLHRSAGRVGLWIAALTLLLGLPLLAAAAPAGAQSTTTAPAGEPGAEDVGDTTVQGVVINRAGTRDRGDDEPVEGVDITVADEGGDEIETATTDEEGAWSVVVPGAGSYTVTLDPDSLPDDVGIADGENEVTVSVVRDGDTKSAFFNGVGARERAATTTFDRFLQLAFTGVRFGLIIGITSIGLSLIFGTTGLTNFAHGEMVTFGGIIAWYANVSWGIQMIPATVLAVITGAALAALLELGIWRPLRHRGMALLSMMVVSIGLAIVLRYSFQLVFGASPRVYADYQNQTSYEVGPVRMAPRDLWTIALIIITLVAVAFLLQRTKIGKAMRAVSDNRDLAASSGIDVDRVILFVWGLGGSLAALGGVLFALNERISFNSGFNLLLLMFAGITLGGLGTAYGALVGSFVVGLFIQISTLWVSPELKNVSALLVLILVLLIRPQGILGQRERVG